MPSTAPTSVLRKLLDERLSALAGEVDQTFAKEAAERVDAAVREAASASREAARRELGEELNQAARRLRQASGVEEIGATLADAAGAFCDFAAVFLVRGGKARGHRVRGAAAESAVAAFSSLEFALAEAPALAGAVESKEPVFTMGTAREVSRGVAECFAHPAEQRIFLCPLVVGGAAEALLYAAGPAEPAPLELLAQVAAATLEAQRQPAPAAAPAGFVSIQPAGEGPGRSGLPGWPDLSPEDQQVHLRAQRFARVYVAEIRLQRPDAVKTGRARRDLYAGLRDLIESGREVFRQKYFTASSTMVDYLHLELTHTLANDDPALLGEQYPGPLV
jgi:hypothetical protein